MLSVSEFPQFRSQNDASVLNLGVAFSGQFLAANYYPIQTPGYTVHWTETELKVVERVGEGAKIVLELDTRELRDHGVLFDTVPKHERRKMRNSGNSFGVLKSIRNWFQWSKPDPNADALKIVQVIPLMYDQTLFDLLVVVKNKNIYGFVRMRLLTTGNFGNVQRMEGFIPAVEGDLVKIVNWKSLLVAVTRPGKIIILDLMGVEAEWREQSVNFDCEDVIICEDRNRESAVLLLQSAHTVQVYDFTESIIKKVGYFDRISSRNMIGYLEGDDLYVIQGTTLHKTSLKFASSKDLKELSFNFNDCVVSYLVPWRQDFQVSALIVGITKNEEDLHKISVISLEGDQATIVHESEVFKSEEIVSLFVTSSLEIFLLDRSGSVIIYSGLLLCSDWDWQKGANDDFTFEFSQWFNILGLFPFLSVEYYKKRRTEIDDTLFIDELLLRDNQLTFPPTDWKGLGLACTKLKVEIILYYLLASQASPEKINLFYYNFGLNDRQVAFIEACYYADHGQLERASKIFCTRKMDEGDRNVLVPKLVRLMRGTDELIMFSLFAAGRLISIDLLMEDRFTIDLMIESILNGRGMSTALEWIKGLFAWLRPDDRCALTPVALLHQQLMKRIVNVLLAHPSNAKFRSLGSDLVESQFDPDTLRSVLDHLGESCRGDRAAWLITMICAARGRLHKYLLEYDFEAMVEDEEVLRGIEAIKTILRPLVKDSEDVWDNSDSQSSYTDKSVYDNYESSPVVVPGTPQMKRSSSSKCNTPLLNVYVRQPSSPATSLYSSPNSPTFTPKHYPPRKPTTLSSSLRKESRTVEGEEEEDPFKYDFIRANGKRTRDELLELKNKSASIDGSDGDVVLLTKNDGMKFESVINVPVKRKRRRRD